MKLHELELVQVYEKLLRERGEPVTSEMPPWTGCLPQTLRLHVRYHGDSAAIAALVREHGVAFGNERVRYFEGVFLTTRIGELLALPQVDGIEAPELTRGDARGELLRAR